MALASAALVCSPDSGKNRSGSQVAAGGLVQPRLPAVVLDHRDGPLRPARPRVALRWAVRSGPRTCRTRPSRTPTRRATSAKASRWPPSASHSRHSCSIRWALVRVPPRSAARVPRT